MAGLNLIRKVSKPQNSPIALQNAAAWNAPGGGYDKWRANDPQREQALPVGSILPKAPPPADADDPAVSPPGLAGMKIKKSQNPRQ